MFFRQLIDLDTSTFTYLLADQDAREAVIIDSVREQLDRDAELITQIGLTLVGALETHVHADHVTGAGALRERFGCRIFVGKDAGVLTADAQIEDGDTISFGCHRLEARSTPGHTNGCLTYVCQDEGVAFTGDALLIRGCGRTDFQQGSPIVLYESVRKKIFSLPEDTRLYPGHDYRGRTVTTVAEEKRFNPRLGEDKTVEAFTAIMNALELAYPTRIDEAVPANMASGVTEPEEAQPSNQDWDRWAPIERTTSGVPVVSPGWVASHADQVRIIDVREHIEFCGPLGHVEKAELIPLSALPDEAGTWNRNEKLVTVCAYGTRSGKAALILAKMGFCQVASLHGGMTRWLEEGQPAVEIMGDRMRQDAAAWLGTGI